MPLRPSVTELRPYLPAAREGAFAPVMIALHRRRPDAGDSARDVLSRPRHAPSETGAPFGDVPFRPAVFPDLLRGYS